MHREFCAANLQAELTLPKTLPQRTAVSINSASYLDALTETERLRLAPTALRPDFIASAMVMVLKDTKKVPLGERANVGDKKGVEITIGGLLIKGGEREGE